VEAIQTVEYLRSFLLGRTAWSRLHAMPFISGALGAVAENVGFRQIHAWWRLRGIATAVAGRGTTWSHVAGEGQHAPVA
jgi:hypothetical protein